MQDAWNQTAAFARALGVTVILFQCPASLRPTPENLANLRNFFSSIDRQGLHCVWEPRGEWPAKQIAGLCAELNLVHGVDPFQNTPLRGAFQYFRLHGITGYRYRYAESDLEKLRNWACQKPTYALFNNISMSEDAQRFLRLLAKESHSSRPFQER